MPKLNFTPAQEAAISHRGGALLISAGAGSGKTRVLIERLMGLVAEGRDIDRFLVITYTRAAAAELRERLSAAISERLAENPEDAFMRRQASLIYRAQIGTIHSFCSDIIRESAHLAGVKPGFRQLDEQEAEAMLADCLTDELEARYDGMSEEFRALTDMLGAGRDDSRLVSIALETYAAVQSHPDPEAWMRRQIDTPVPDTGAEKTVWGALIMSEIRSAASYWRGRMAAELPYLEGVKELEKGWLTPWRATVASLEGCLAALDAGWDSALGFGRVEFPRLNTPKGMGGDGELERLKALREACKKAMASALGRMEADSAGLMADMRKLKGVTDELYRLVIGLIRAYSEEKRRRGALDFGDLEHLALKILVGGDGRPTARAEEISRRYDEILVDEYQDVNRVQELIFTAVSRAGRNMTMVGDVKQSIYRFRLADPSIFLEKYNSYPDAPAAEGEASRIILKHNFRSRPELLDRVNLVFSRLMSRRLGEMDYGEAEAMLPGREPSPEAGEAFELCFAEVPDDREAAEYEAECAASYIARLVRDKGAAPGDFAILLRSFRAKAEIFAAALRARGIACSVSGASAGLFDGWENKLLLEILRVIDNPMLDIPLVGVLKSPVCGFTADELAFIRAAAPAEPFYGALCVRAETDGRCKAFLAALGELREAAAGQSAEAVIMLALEKTGLAALAEARETGSSERLYLAADYARSCESAGSAGLYSFLRRVDAASAPGFSHAAPEGVAIMSIHASKGLEFPYVLLCDLSHRFNMQDQQRPLLVHRDLGAGAKFRDLNRGIEYSSLARNAIAALIRSETLSEELRVMYVAMTRARERLVCLFSVRDAEKTLRDISASVSEPPEAEELVSQRSMGQWLVSALAGTPGFRYSILAPDAAGQGDEPSAREETPPDAAMLERLRASLAWQAPGASAGLPSKLTATSLKGSLLALEAAEDAGEMPGISDARRDIMRRPSFVTGRTELTGGERGTALHKAMQLLDHAKTGSEAEIASEIDRMRRLRLISEAEAEAVEPEKLLAFFRSPLGRRVLAAELVRREFKFSVLLPAAEVYGRGEGEVLLQGVIDLFFKEPDGFVIVDFKSDRITRAQRAERAGEYAGQLRAYSEALSRITGARVKETLLYFFECDGGI